jgi:hypothetical protein
MLEMTVNMKFPTAQRRLLKMVGRRPKNQRVQAAGIRYPYSCSNMAGCLASQLLRLTPLRSACVLHTPFTRKVVTSSVAMSDKLFVVCCLPLISSGTVF